MSLAGIFSYTDKATNWPIKIAILHESAAAYFAIFVVGNGRGALTPPVFWAVLAHQDMHYCRAF